MEILNMAEVFETIFYCILGLMLFVLAYFLIEKVTPYSVRKEIEEDQNISLGIIIGSMMIGLALIIASSISG